MFHCHVGLKQLGIRPKNLLGGLAFYINQGLSQEHKNPKIDPLKPTWRI